MVSIKRMVRTYTRLSSFQIVMLSQRKQGGEAMSVPEDSILRRHHEQMQQGSTAPKNTAAQNAAPEDSILRRHYEQMQQSGGASAAAPESPVSAPAREPAPAPRPAAPPPPAAEPARPSKGFFARLFGKLFGG